MSKSLANEPRPPAPRSDPRPARAACSAVAWAIALFIPRSASACACVIAQPTTALPTARAQARVASARAPLADAAAAAWAATAALQAEIVRSSRSLPRRHYRHHGDRDHASMSRRSEAIDLKKLLLLILLPPRGDFSCQQIASIPQILVTGTFPLLRGPLTYKPCVSTRAVLIPQLIFLRHQVYRS